MHVPFGTALGHVVPFRIQILPVQTTGVQAVDHVSREDNGFALETIGEQQAAGFAALRYWHSLFHYLGPHVPTVRQDTSVIRFWENSFDLFASRVCVCLRAGSSAAHLEDLGVLGSRQLPVRLDGVVRH